MSAPAVDVLISTYRRPAALAVTLTSLCSQTYEDFRVVVSDQTDGSPSFAEPEVKAVLRVLGLRHEVSLFHHIPRRGMAEQREFLLSRADAPYVLYLDDDLLLGTNVIRRLVTTLQEQDCGFVGAGPIGLSYAGDVRPEEQWYEPWEGKVGPEVVRPSDEAWQRHRLHNAANLLHLQQRLGLSDNDRIVYKVAWVGACVLYDRSRLLHSGGFSFWQDLPDDHCGEDVLAQLRVMAEHGGCGLLPSGVYHLQLETTLPDRRHDAPFTLQHLRPH